MQNKNRWLILIFFVSIFSACAPLNGNIHLLEIHEQDNRLYGPWRDSDSPNGLIGKKSTPSNTNEDSFTLYFDQAFFKYMSDMWGQNEIVLVFTFNEGDTDNDDKKIVKVIGPMERTGDESYGSSIGMVTYGPKRVEGQIISVQVQVIEFDGAEKDNQSAFLDFIGGAAETLSLANPVTAAEISIAKEIAKALIGTNESDVILDFKFDILPKDLNTIKNSSNDHHRPIPLKPGNWAIIKQEKCPLLRCYWPIYNNVGELTWGNSPLKFVALVADIIVTTVPTTLAKLFLDTPKSESVEPLSVSFDPKETEWHEVDDNGKQIKVSQKIDSGASIESITFDADKKRVTTKIGEEETINELILAKSGHYKDAKKTLWFEPNSRKLMLKDADGQKPYEAKTWITFSIEQGRDPSNWEKRKALRQSEADILSKIKEPSSLSAARINETLTNLKKARAELTKIESRGSISLVVPESEVSLTTLTKKTKFEFQHAKELKDHVKKVRIYLIKVEGNKDILEHEKEVAIDSNSSTTTIASFIPGLNFKKGKYRLFLDYEDPDSLSMTTASFDLSVIE